MSRQQIELSALQYSCPLTSHLHSQDESGPPHDSAAEALMSSATGPSGPDPAQRLPDIFFLWLVPMRYHLLHTLNISLSHSH